MTYIQSPVVGIYPSYTSARVNSLNITPVPPAPQLSQPEEGCDSVPFPLIPASVMSSQFIITGREGTVLRTKVSMFFSLHLSRTSTVVGMRRIRLLWGAVTGGHTAVT